MSATPTKVATKRGSSPWRVLKGLFIGLAVVVQLTPFYLSVITAIKPISDDSSLWLPPFAGITIENFTTAMEVGRLDWALENNFIVTVASTILVCIVAAMAAYPLARRTTKLNRFVSLALLGMLIVPPLSILVPLYTMLSGLGALNTFGGLILVLTTLHLPLAIFLFTQFMRRLPISLEEAASIDGAGIFTIFTRIVLPSLKPVLATVTILTATSVWNDFAMSSYINNAASMRTLAPSVAVFFSVEGTNLGAAAAAALLGLLPILFTYLALQKYFVKGAVAGAEK